MDNEMIGQSTAKALKRNSIIDAAIRAFSRKGYQSASMDHIACMAGVSKRTIYNHFSSKEQLFKTVLDRLIKDMSTVKQISYSPTRKLEDQLADFVKANAVLAEKSSTHGLIKALFSELVGNKQLNLAARQRMQEAEQVLVGWLKAAADDGKINVVDFPATARLFWSMMKGVFMWSLVFRNSRDFQTVNKLKMELVKTFLCRYGYDANSSGE